MFFSESTCAPADEDAAMSAAKPVTRPNRIDIEPPLLLSSRGRDRGRIMSHPPLPARLGGIALLGEQLKAHRLRAFIFNFEIARHGGRADIEGMRLAGPPIGQHPEPGSRTVKLRLIPHDNGGASGGRDGCKSPH